MTRPITTDASSTSDGPASGMGHGNRAQQILVLLGAFGHLTHETLLEHVGNPDLVSNAHVLAICDLALRGPLRPRDLQVSAALTSGGTTKLLDRLEELCLVERAYGQVEGDRRGIVVSLTPEGRRAAGQMSAALESRIDAVRGLAAELAALLEG